MTQWVSLGGEQTETITLESGKHYYLTADVTGAPESGVLLSGAGCIDLNGFNITAGEGCTAISCGSGTTAIMGTGTITGSRAVEDTGATIHTASSAVVHIYGGTITKSGNYPAIYIGKNAKVHLYDGAHINTAGTFSTYPTAVTMQQTGSLFHMHGGTITGGTTTGNGGAIRVSAGSMIMDDGIIYGGQASRGGVIAVNKDVSSKATLTVNGGTITGGTATASNGGGNLYVNYVTITINGGLITKGTATDTSYGGGNLGSRLGTFIINGGTISEGTTSGSKGGGNIYLSGATLEMNGGTITGGTSSCSETMSGGGNVFMYSGSTFTQNDGVITLGTSASSYGGGNIYLDDSTYNMYDGEITYGTATHTSCRGGGNIYVQSDDCLVNIVGGTVRYGWLAAGNGNNIHQRYGKCYLGKDALLGTKGTDTKGNMSLYVYSGTLESYGTFTGGIRVREGYAYLKGGQYYSFYYDGSKTCQITGGQFRIDYSTYVPEGYQWVTVTTSGSYKYVVLPEGGKTDAVLVDYEGKEILTNTPVGLFDRNTYSHIKLYNAVTLGVTKELWVDLNGQKLTVTGESTLNAFDTANDTYDATACGTITNNGTAQITQDLQAPNGNRYLAITDENGISMHRVALGLTTVTLRSSQAGLYYKAIYYCDDALTQKVQSYGVVLSVNNMPGNDFISGDTDDINRYTVTETPFRSGITATSGAVYDIMKVEREPATNEAYGKVDIYANPYILFNLNEETVCVGDTENAGKSTADADFTGHAYSLLDVLNAIDKVYYDYSEATQATIENFYATWKNTGISWVFTNIGKDYVAPEVPEEPEEPEEEKDVLELVDGQALCTACNKTVTWTPIYQGTDDSVAYGTATTGSHLYLAEDITYTGSGSAYLTIPNSSAGKACVHLNGHSLTTTKHRAFTGTAGTLNVMGDGVVTGYTGTAGYGCIVLINTTGSKGKVNLYGGTYRQQGNVNANSYLVSVRNSGGAINIYENAHLEANVTGRAAWTGPCNSTNSTLGLYGATVDGDIYISGANQEKGKTSTLILDNTTVNGRVDILGVNTVLMRGAPKVELMDVAPTTQLTLEEMTEGADIPIYADGILTAANENAAGWAQYFKPLRDGAYIQEIDNVLHYLPEIGTKKILVIGNSMTYYGKYVIEKSTNALSLDTRINDTGYLYQVFKANGINTEVTNFVYPNHRFKDFYSGCCAANRGHDGHNHLEDLTDRDYDYVILQEGSGTSSVTNIYDEAKPLMDLFLEVNPDTKFVLMIQQTAHTEGAGWMSSVKELDEKGIAVVDWGGLVNDVVNGTLAVPGATQTYHKFSFVVNKSSTDGRHPNVLAGYLAAQMTYCAIMNDTAVGKDYSFWNDAAVNSAFDIVKFKNTYYSYDSTKPSNTNFLEIFASEADMNGLHQLIDWYLENKPYLEY